MFRHEWPHGVRFQAEGRSRSVERGFTADIATGSGANTMDTVKSGYQKSDIVVRDKDGRRIDLSKEVTITGTQNSSKDPVSKNLVCYLKVYKIEQ